MFFFYYSKLISGGSEYEITFLRQREGTWSFSFPEKEDKCYVEGSNILLKVNPPTQQIHRSIELIFDDAKLHDVKYNIL